VELTSSVLESIGEVFAIEESKSIMSKKAIQDAKNIIKRYEGVFSDINYLVENKRKASKDGKKSLGMMGSLQVKPPEPPQFSSKRRQKRKAVPIEGSLHRLSCWNLQHYSSLVFRSRS
jgi:hypothetical protein